MSITVKQVIKRIVFGKASRTLIDERTNIPELKMLLEAVASTSDDGNIVTYHDTVGPGKSILRGLMKRKAIAVLDCVIEKGVVFPEHKHANEAEWLMVYEGEIEFTLEGETRIIKAGEYVEIQPEQAHITVAITDARILAVTMPADEGFPNGISEQ